MKKILLLLLSIFVSYTLLFSQEGKGAFVTFAVTYKGVKAEEMEFMPTEVRYYVLGNKLRQEIPTTDMTTVVITDGDSLSLINLFDIDENHHAVTYDMKMIKKMSSSLEIKVELQKGTWKILGYDCLKYEVSIYDKDAKERMSEVIFVTDKLGGPNQNFFFYKDVKGFILRSEKQMGGKTIIREAKDIKLRTIPLAMFQVPEYYILSKD